MDGRQEKLLLLANILSMIFLKKFVSKLSSLIGVGCVFLSGMTVQIFKSFPSILEVECWGGYLAAEVKLISLRLFRVSDHSLNAFVNPLTSECKTYEEFSSCVIDPVDSRRSKVRVLVADLDEEERREYGCTATSFGPLGDTHTEKWFLNISRPSKYVDQKGSDKGLSLN